MVYSLTQVGGFNDPSTWSTTNYTVALAGSKFARIIGTPVAPTAPSAPAPSVQSVAPTIPDPSLAGQAWGWPIPITAGRRAIPGRLIRRRLTRGSDGHYILDGLVSFGWRAEVMGGFDPATFDATKLVANGVDIWLKDVLTFPGGTVTIYDGLQVLPVWEDIDGVGNAPAYIFNILADVRGLPLTQFNDQVPDQWSLHCQDVAGSSSFTGIRPRFGTAHYSGISLSTTTSTDDTASGSGTALSLDRLPPGKTVLKIRVVTAGTDSRLGLSQELLAGDPNLATTPGFGTTGVVLKRDGSLYDGFPRPGPGLTWGSGSYILLLYNSATGDGWVAGTNAGGTSITWYGDPAAGTGATWNFGFAGLPHAAVFGSGGEVFEFVQPVASEIPVGFTAYSPDPSGITLPRWFQLAAGLTYDLKGKVTVDPAITDTLDSLFFVDGQSTFNRDALAMARATGCFVREENNGIFIGRGVNGTSFTVSAAIPESALLRDPGASALTISRLGEQTLPSAIRVQAIASEASFRFTELGARWERGPKPITTSTKVDTIRIQAGMVLNQIETYASNTLARETEARDQVEYKLPWAYAVKVQPGDIHTVPEDTVTHTVQVMRADRQPNRTVSIQAVRLHSAQDYAGVSDIGTSSPGFVASAPITGTLAAVEAPDTAAFAGNVSAGGTLSATEASDTASFSGASASSGTLSATESADTASASGSGITPSYANAGGTGNRTASITATTTCAIGGGAASNTVDGAITNAFWISSLNAGQYLRWDFGAGVYKNITEIKWYQSDSTTGGNWNIQGSIDGLNWESLGSITNIGGATSSTYPVTIGGTDGYRFYRLVKTDSTRPTAFIREVEFKIDAASAVADVSQTPRYLNDGGSGDRTATITVTSSIAPSGGTLSNLVDGGFAQDTTDSMFGGASTSGNHFTFDFGSGAAKIVTEVTWWQHNTTTHGTWKVQGSNDGSTFTDIGSTFTLGGVSTGQAITTPSANTTAYRYYRLQQTAGAIAASSPYMQEVEFKIAVP